MSDAYRSNLERIQGLIQQLRSDIQKREQKFNANQPVGIIDGEIRGLISKIEREIELLKSLIERQNQNQEILQKEGETRKNKLLELQNVAAELKQTFDKSLRSKQDQLFDNRSNGGKQYKDTETLQQMDNKQLHSNQKQLQKEQEQKLDVCIDQLDTLKVQSKNIGNTVDEQNRLLGEIEKDMDKTNKEMINVNGKLKKFLNSSSYCCLYLFIALELVGLVMIILFV
ncbi:unnamed protein product (macronuclear) [Paramecium tetraurelia]|uniref:t-SNARE coiled-coil homology domain-containing protein n=1 Tax=Paramecium tetraurelia TaxID=5888 RepID=A0DYD8_PARTE|nr:uncharacterized protein GSPATT00003023001 [Paramecium tetraurelia]CAK88055.1 unnamed protein product [Paramecium tetraurelia]|eukprot:XP_001455452.1 hypothetical protein (macronuclear) [Paramecium tetraurelia strain d4-2]